MKSEGNYMFLPCYHTEWFIELTQVSPFGQVGLCIASPGSGVCDIGEDEIDAFMSIAEAQERRLQKDLMANRH